MQAKKEVEQAEKKQVRHLAKVCMQRLQKRGLARAWNALREHAVARQRTLRRMHATAQRLVRPKQTAVFAHWRHSWTQSQSRAKVRDTATALAEEMERRRLLEEEVEHLRVGPQVHSSQPSAARPYTSMVHHTRPALGGARGLPWTFACPCPLGVRGRL